MDYLFLRIIIKFCFQLNDFSDNFMGDFLRIYQIIVKYNGSFCKYEDVLDFYNLHR